MPPKYGKETIQRFDPPARAGDYLFAGGFDHPGEDFDCRDADVCGQVGHSGANVWEKLGDVVFHVVAWQGAKKFEKLGADIAVSVEDEWEQRREHNAHWLREG